MVRGGKVCREREEERYTVYCRVYTVIHKVVYTMHMVNTVYTLHVIYTVYEQRIRPIVL
jgi:hypothetical protein